MTKTVTVRFTDAEGTEREARVEPDGTVMDAARDVAVDILATCGERGRCRTCRVKVLKGDVPPATIMDEVQLGPDEVHEGFRLSCQTRVIADCHYLLAPPKTESGHQLLSAERDPDAGGILLDSGVEKRLVKANAPVEEDEQTTDTEEIRMALGADVVFPLELAARLPGVLRAKSGNVTVTTFAGEVLDVEAGDTTEQCYGMAFDIGTTSVVGSLLDLATGEQLAQVGNVNPQAVFGGDLMSRIAFAQFNLQNLKKLRARIVGAINGHIKEACEEADVDPAQIYKLVIVGNTCMHHIFLGIDPTYVGLAPYAPVVRDPLVLTPKEALLKAVPNARICMLPIVAGFVGADATAAVLATRLDESDGIRIMVDIGTNGEMVMAAERRTRRLLGARRAGPRRRPDPPRHARRHRRRREGGNRRRRHLSCDRRRAGDGHLRFGPHRRNRQNALGRGARRFGALLNFKTKDALPKALADRFIEEDGRQFVLAWADQSGKGENVTLTQQDVRQLQLAKGAILAGIMMLMSVNGVSKDDLSELLLAGAFGNYINKESAVHMRLLPDMPLEKITYVGNAAALGAQMALLSETERSRAADLARRIRHVSLGMHPEFQGIFVDAMSFTAAQGAKVRAAVGNL